MDAGTATEVYGAVVFMPRFIVALIFLPVLTLTGLVRAFFAHNEGGINHRPINLGAGVQRHLEAGLGPPQRLILAQAPEDVLHVNNSIIHDRPNGDGQAADGDRVERDPEFIQQDDGAQQQKEGWPSAK